jgi:hypothetical protein
MHPRGITLMRYRIGRALLMIVAAVLSVAHSQVKPDRITSVEVAGTIFRIQMASGKVLSGADLVGATLSLTQSGNPTLRKVKIEAIQPDPLDTDHEILLYHLLAVDSATGGTAELCGPNPQGERWGFPLRGQWDHEGQHFSDAGYTLTCADGAQGKCVRFGYKPWKTLANGVRLASYHQACVRMIRADYCGGHGTTRNGMPIGFYDAIGISTRTGTGQGMRFEAAWTPNGAACVAHTRVPENVTLAQLGTQCPRLMRRLGERACSEDLAKSFQEPVLFYNFSP